MKLYLKLIFLFCSLFFIAKAQNIPIGQWRDHLTYNNCIAVAEAENKIYCATESALFYLDKSDNMLSRLNKINGLSDIGISTIRYNKKYKMLIVAYKNTNIDIIDKEGNISNFPDIRRKQILGNKTINKITISDDYAFLSCSFGVIVLNIAKREIKDTYTIGPQGNALEVFDFTADISNYYAATSKGIFYANINGANLADFNSWQQINSLPYPSKKYNAIIAFNGRIYANQSNPGYSKDSMYVYDGNEWKVWKPYTNIIVNNLQASYDRLIMTAYGFTDVFDKNGNLISHLWTYNPGWITAMDATFDKDLFLWIADKQSGLVKNYDEFRSEKIIPDGPSTNNVFSMALADNKLWVTSGGKDDTWNNIWTNYGVYNYENSKWTSFTRDNTSEIDSVFDYISVAIDPVNSDNAYIGTWSKGMIWFKNNNFYKYFNEANSSLRPFNPFEGYSLLRIGGICFDDYNNMWVTNPGADYPLSVKMPGENGAWKSFRFNNISNTTFLSNIIIDDNYRKWIIIPRGGGILVFDDNGTITQTSDDKYKILSSVAGNGNLPSNNVLSIAKDLEGEIWIGTDHGVAVIYSPYNVFSNQDFDAQQILLQQDGHWQYLLETESVTAIAVDGANRKWIGTQSSGVFLMSPDGTKQIARFTSDNSPLFSNTITSIAINHNTGEVFFGTSNGIISYKSDATQGKEDFSDKDAVYAYPNPVKENYEGNVAIKGLVTNADVRITAIDGSLVYTTKALGGQAIWNCRNFEGRKAKSGVYLVFCSNDDGSQTLVTKILVIN